MSVRQQVELDISLNNKGSEVFAQHSDTFAQDNQWKSKIPDIIEGREKPEIIKKVISVIERDIETHKRAGNKLTGSLEWHKAWINVYENWLKNLNWRLNGTQAS